jgi:4-amino-4-deoxy-L-arabinose transferase-like glycosyltransferase
LIREEKLNENSKTSNGSGSRLFHIATLYGHEKVILVIMAAFQVIWLISIGLLGASSNWGRLIGIAIISIFAGSAVVLLPDKIPNSILERLKTFFRSEKRLLILLLAFCFIIGVIYAYFQRIWVFDEEQNFRLAGVLSNQGFPAFLSEYIKSPYFANQHPPLVAMINGLVMRLFGVNLVVARLVSLMFCMGIIWLTFLCGRELADGLTGLLSAALLVTFPLIMRLGTVAMLDIPVTFFFLLSIFLFLLIVKKPSILKAVVLGFTITAGFLSRYSGIFIIPVLAGFLCIDSKYRKVWGYLLIAFLIFGLFLIGYLWYVHSLGLIVPNISNFLPIGLDHPIKINRSVLPGWALRGKEFQVWRWALNSIITRLPSAIGVYNLPVIVLGAILAVSTRKRQGKMLLLWIIVVSVLLILTLPDHRYFMPIFPALALLAGLWLRDHPAVSVQVIFLAFLLLFGALLLFVDWQREAQLFISS